VEPLISEKDAAIAVPRDEVEHLRHGKRQMTLLDLDQQKGVIPEYCLLSTPQYFALVSLDVYLEKRHHIEGKLIEAMEADVHRLEFCFAEYSR
jgi:hypothetical protein